MLKHLAPAVVVTVLLAASTVVFASDAATAPASPIQENQTQVAAGDTVKTFDATAPKPKKTKLHRVARVKTKKAIPVSAKQKAPAASPAPATGDAAKTN